MLDNAVNMLTQGVTFLGGVLVVFGLINLGMTIKDGMQGGGGQLSGAIAMIVGGAIVVGAAIYFVLGWNVGDNMMLIYAVSLPFWCCGFIRPKGMPFEQFAALWLKANFGVERIFYVPSMQLSGLIASPDGKNVKKGRVYGKHYRKQCSLKGIESYSPRAGHVIA